MRVPFAFTPGVTFPAAPSTSRRDVGVGYVERMPVLAMRPVRFRVVQAGVLGGGHQLEMLGVDAGPVLAPVMDVLPGENRADVQYVEGPVRVVPLAVHVDAAVPVGRVDVRPDPAAVPIHLVPHARMVSA